MLVVVGGHSRNVGKTSVVVELIRALPEFRWTAMKITQHGHGVCSNDGQPCGCATSTHTWAIDEEADRSGLTDTSRFLAAGAERAWWVRTEQGRLAEAMPEVRSKLAEADYAIVESNSLLKFVRPDLYLSVLDPETTDFKTSAQEFLDRADAFLIHDRSVGVSPAKALPDDNSIWERVSLRSLAHRPIFRIIPPPYVTPELIAFVRSRLTSPVSVTDSNTSR
jgi:molybdopterin-guanine dinucleotide biosynthesis protein